MFCTKCGEKIIDGSRFCTGCGQPIQMEPQSHNEQKSIEKQVYQFEAPVNKRDLNMSKPSKKAHGVGLAIVLIFLIIAVLTCMLFIIFVQDSDKLDGLKKQSIEQQEKAEGESEFDNNEPEIDEQLPEVITEEEIAEEVDAVDYLAQAQEAYDSYDYELALQCCSMALQQGVFDENVYALEAEIYVDQQEYEQAAMALSEGIIVTDSIILENRKNQLISNMIKTSCSEYNSLGTLICEIQYNEEGNAIRYTSYSDGKAISSIEECEYDGLGNITGKKHYNGNMSLEWQEYYDYDSDGDVIRCTHYNAKNRKEWMDEYSYDSSGRKIETTRYNADGSLAWWDEYTYVSDEKYSKIAHPASGQTVVFQYTSAFDELGNEVEFVEYDASGNCVSSWQKEYNVWGDVTKYTYGDAEVNYDYTYTYNKQ